MSLKRMTSASVLILVAASLAACGGEDGGSTDNPAFEEGLDSRGPITYVQGKDNSGVVAPLIEKWNADHPDEEVTFKEQSDEALGARRWPGTAIDPASELDGHPREQCLPPVEGTGPIDGVQADVVAGDALVIVPGEA